MRVKTDLDFFTKRLLEHRVWGFDTMVFVYLFESNPRYFPLAQKAVKLLEERKLKAVTSIISPIELLSSKSLEGEPEKREEYRDFFKKERNLRTVELSWEIVELTAQLRRSYLLRTPDAIQLATAQIFKAQAFLTNDDFFHKIKDFPILFLKDFVK